MRVFFPELTAMTRYNSVECACVELVRAEGATQSGGHLRMRRGDQPPLTNTITQEEGSRVDRRGVDMVLLFHQDKISSKSMFRKLNE